MPAYVCWINKECLQPQNVSIPIKRYQRKAPFAPSSLPPSPPRLPIYLVGCNMALWNKPVFQFAIKAASGWGGGGEGVWDNTHSRSHNYLGSPISSFLKFILLLFVYFSIGKGVMMQGEKALKDPAPTTGRGSWAKLIQRPWALEEGTVPPSPAATPPGPRGAGSPHHSSSLCRREPWKREPGNASHSLRHKDHFKYSLYQQISS